MINTPKILNIVKEEQNEDTAMKLEKRACLSSNETTPFKETPVKKGFFDNEINGTF